MCAQHSRENPPGHGKSAPGLGDQISWFREGEETGWHLQHEPAFPLAVEGQVDMHSVGHSSGADGGADRDVDGPAFSCLSC